MDSDILYCSRFYAEPRFRYQDQELYWLQQPANLAAMAHSKIFSKKDIKITMDFLNSIRKRIQGGRVLDLCGGISRYGKVLESLFDEIDIFDLKPSFGDIEPGKQGRLMRGNLINLSPFALWANYDCIFANWALCYLGFQELLELLSSLYSMLKPNGSLILKEPILSDGETTPRLCRSG